KIFLGRANIIFFGIFGYIRVRGICHRDKWFKAGAIDSSSGAAACFWSSKFGWSIAKFCLRVRAHRCRLGWRRTPTCRRGRVNKYHKIERLKKKNTNTNTN
ncbi:unnamed protein product, partial [Laminaria digitata]